jgi:hypothetical protein
MKPRTTIVLVLIGLLGLIAGLKVLAAESAPSSLGLTVSPPSFELSANPGDVIEETVRITNESGVTLTLEASVEDFKVEGTEGNVNVKTDTDPNAFSTWFRFSQKQFQVKSKETLTVPVRIEVPRNAEPGGHFASVLFNPKVVPGSSDQIGARVVQRVGSLFLMRVSGAVVEDGSIKKLSTKTFAGEWDEVTASDGKTKILVARDEKLTEERPKRWFDRGPVAFDLLFKNNGNVHFKPAGTLTIYNLFGKKVDTLALDPRNVFPGGERRITVIWPRQSLWGVFYRGQVAAVYGSSNKVLTAETWFIGMPVWLAVGVGVFLLTIIFLRRRLARAVGAFIRGR